MSEERFEFREINEIPILPKCYDTEKQEYANLFECVGWLNELYRENEQLKKILCFLENDNAGSILNVLNTQQNEIMRLIEEKEQLKRRLESKEKAHTRCDGLYWKLYDEKEQLKKRLDEVLKELYCKDRRLEELGEDIGCCDK